MIKEVLYFDGNWEQVWNTYNEVSILMKSLLGRVFLYKSIFDFVLLLFSMIPAAHSCGRALPTVAFTSSESSPEDTDVPSTESLDLTPGLLHTSTGSLPQLALPTSAHTKLDSYDRYNYNTLSGHNF